MMSTVTFLRVAARFFHWDINTSASEKPTAFPNRSDFPLRRGSRVESVPFFFSSSLSLFLINKIEISLLPLFIPFIVL